jgi:hypothetical protein
MASVQFVKAKVVMIGGTFYAECPRIMNINCENSQVKNLAWLVPQVNDGIVTGYIVSLDSAKPTPDSIHVLQVIDKTKDIEYAIAIADGDTDEVFIDKCNGCCDGDTDMSNVTIPTPYAEENGVVDEDGKYVYLFPIPFSELDLAIAATNLIVNGAEFAVEAEDEYADAAALLAFAQTASPGGLADAGTWSLVEADNGQKFLKLVSTTAVTAYLGLTSVAQVLKGELDDAAPITVDSVLIGGVVTALPGGAITFTVAQYQANPAVLHSALAPVVIGTLASCETGGAYVMYTGFQALEELQNNGATVSAFAAGACV